MAILLVGIFASSAISEAWANKLFHGKEAPATPQNAAEGQRDGTAGKVEDGDNE